jgi:hypothetical protein
MQCQREQCRFIGREAVARDPTASDKLPQIARSKQSLNDAKQGWLKTTQRHIFCIAGRLQKYILNTIFGDINRRQMWPSQAWQLRKQTCETGSADKKNYAHEPTCVLYNALQTNTITDETLGYEICRGTKRCHISPPQRKTQNYKQQHPSNGCIYFTSIPDHVERNILSADPSIRKIIKYEVCNDLT